MFSSGFFPLKIDHYSIQTMQNTLREWDRAAPLCALQPFHLLPQFNNFTSQELQRKKHGNGWKKKWEKKNTNTQKQAALEILPQIPNLSMQEVWKLCVCVCVREKERERESLETSPTKKRKKKKSLPTTMYQLQGKIECCWRTQNSYITVAAACLHSIRTLVVSVKNISHTAWWFDNQTMPRGKKRKEKKKHHPRNKLVKKTLSHLENFIIKLQIQKSQKIKAWAHFWTIFWTILQICCQLASHNQQQLLLMLIEAWAF